MIFKSYSLILSDIMNFGDILVYTMTFFGIYTTFYFLLTLFEMRKGLTRDEVRDYPTVSIIVPCYNEENTVIKTLKSLLALDYDHSKLDIMVVDDGSSDKTYDLVKKYVKDNSISEIRVFKKENGGKYTALNFALKNSKAEFFGALDADSFVDKKALRRLMAYFYSKDVMAVTPSMKVFDPKSWLERIQGLEFMMGIFLRKVFAQLGSIHVTPGPFSIYKRSFVEKHGFYRKAHHTEDIEMALRIQKYHYIIENSVDAYVYTMGLTNFNSLLKQRLRWYSGFIKNVIDYKELFSTRHGNLGIFILPSSFISVLLVIISMFYIITKGITLFYSKYLNFAAVNFDILKLEWFKFDWFFVNTNPIAILSIISLVLALIVLMISKKMSGEKNSISFSYILYMAVYWFLFGFWWILSIGRVLRGKDKGWGHKSD